MTKEILACYNEDMEPSKQLIDELEREDIARARQMTFSQKFLAGAELFDYACEVSRSGIRMQRPEFNERQVNDELRRRLAIGERLAEAS